MRGSRVLDPEGELAARDALEPGQLMAETGLRPEVAVPLLDALVVEHRVQRVVQDGDAVADALSRASVPHVVQRVPSRWGSSSVVNQPSMAGTWVVDMRRPPRSR